MRYLQNTKTRIGVRFDSVEDMMQATSFAESHANPAATAKQRWINMQDLKDRDVDPDWTEGITDADSLANLFANPPEWLIEAGTKCLDTINAAVGSRLDAPIKRRRRIGVEDGDSVNIDRFLVRSPEPWERMDSYRNTTPIVTITVDLVTSAGQSRESLLWRGAAAVGAAMQIERLGGQCEIIGINAVAKVDGERRLIQEILIKPVHEKATLSSTLICTGHVGFYRYAVLNSFFACSVGRVAGGMGQCMDTPISVLKDVGCDIHIGRNCTSASKAIAEANAAIESFDKKGQEQYV